VVVSWGVVFKATCPEAALALLKVRWNFLLISKYSQAYQYIVEFECSTDAKAKSSSRI
jgi:hypothetical protein